MKSKTVGEVIEDLHKLSRSEKVYVMRECKACFKVVNETPVVFYRIDKYAREKKKEGGHKCPCGYLNTNK